MQHQVSVEHVPCLQSLRCAVGVCGQGPRNTQVAHEGEQSAKRPGRRLKPSKSRPELTHRSDSRKLVNEPVSRDLRAPCRTYVLAGTVVSPIAFAKRPTYMCTALPATVTLAKRSGHPSADCHETRVRQASSSRAVLHRLAPGPTGWKPHRERNQAPKRSGLGLRWMCTQPARVSPVRP